MALRITAGPSNPQQCYVFASRAKVHWDGTGNRTWLVITFELLRQWSSRGSLACPRHEKSKPVRGPHLFYGLPTTNQTAGSTDPSQRAHHVPYHARRKTQ